MKAHELLETYPIAGKIIIDYYKQKLAGAGNLSPELEEFLTDELVTKGVCTMIETTPRALLDLLDDRGIYSTLVITYKNSKPEFTVDIDGSVSEDKFDNRHDAELHLLDSAIQMLNNKIG